MTASVSGIAHTAALTASSRLSLLLQPSLVHPIFSAAASQSPAVSFFLRNQSRLEGFPTQNAMHARPSSCQPNVRFIHLILLDLGHMKDLRVIVRPFETMDLIHA